MASKDFEFVKTEPATDYRGRPAGVDVHYRLAGEDKVLSYSNKKEAEHLRRYSARNDAEAAGDRDDPPMGGQNRSLPKGGAYPPSRFHGVPSQAEVKAKGLGAFVKQQSGPVSPRGTLGKLGTKYRAAADRREQGKGAYDEGRSQATRYAAEARKQGYTEKEIDAHLQQHDKAARRTEAAGAYTKHVKSGGDPFKPPGKQVSEEKATRIHEARVIAEAHPDERAELKQMAKDRQRDQPSVETGAKGGRFVRLPGGGKRYVKE